MHPSKRHRQWIHRLRRAGAGSSSSTLPTPRSSRRSSSTGCSTSDPTRQPSSRALGRNRHGTKWATWFWMYKPERVARLDPTRCARRGTLAGRADRRQQDPPRRMTWPPLRQEQLSGPGTRRIAARADAAPPAGRKAATSTAPSSRTTGTEQFVDGRGRHPLRSSSVPAHHTCTLGRTASGERFSKWLFRDTSSAGLYRAALDRWCTAPVSLGAPMTLVDSPRRRARAARDRPRRPGRNRGRRTTPAPGPGPPQRSTKHDLGGAPPDGSSGIHGKANLYRRRHGGGVLGDLLTHDNVEVAVLWDPPLRRIRAAPRRRAVGTPRGHRRAVTARGRARACPEPRHPGPDGQTGGNAQSAR
jgi:hypothetical protein